MSRFVNMREHLERCCGITVPYGNVPDRFYSTNNIRKKRLCDNCNKEVYMLQTFGDAKTHEILCFQCVLKRQREDEITNISHGRRRSTRQGY